MDKPSIIVGNRDSKPIHCYRIIYVARNGWEYARNFCARSRDEAYAKAERAGIEDIIGCEKHDHCLRCEFSRLFHHHRHAS